MINKWNTKKSKSAYDQITLIPSLTKEYPWLKDCDSCALRNSIFNLEDAYKGFYKGKGYPKFKSKDKYNSYKTTNNKSTYKGKKYNSIKLDLENKTITLPKLKEVKIRGYRNLNKIIGIIKSAVIEMKR
jgi:putative transposase